eukprot:scaffold127632_cov63-Phaeocystis_antarctica.AAC.1
MRPRMDASARDEVEDSVLRRACLSWLGLGLADRRHRAEPVHVVAHHHDRGVRAARRRGRPARAQRGRALHAEQRPLGPIAVGQPRRRALERAVLQFVVRGGGLPVRVHQRGELRAPALHEDVHGPSLPPRPQHVLRDRLGARAPELRVARHALLHRGRARLERADAPVEDERAPLGQR